MSNYETLSGDDLNRAIAESLRWFEHTPGKWLQPVDQSTTPQLKYVELPDWANTPGLVLQEIVNDGFQFAIVHDQPGTLTLQVASGASWTFQADTGWYDLHLRLIREWLQWKNPQGPQPTSRQLYE